MNDKNQPPSPPTPEKAERLQAPVQIKEPLSFSVLLNALLKRPRDLIHTIQSSDQLPWLPLIMISSLCLTLFGIVVGSFSGGEQFWAAPLKILLGLSFGALICLPSLYIFACLAGLNVRFLTIIALLLCSISLLSLLLVGFAPVVWLFSTSSNSISFFGFLCIALWTICLTFGFKLLSRCATSLGVSKSSHLKVWMLVFTLVTLQLPTTLRPIIGTSDKLLNFSEKKFFLTHWLEQLGTPTPQNDRSADLN
ncbi:hypothetical protein ACFSW8_13840 [Rubritalea tangerina]|uniref:Yip1 domain-containing protein n=2 Tax=Rubritalea tangerina TaxID=430798 RepID=A0ABW4ZE58_9BACT